MSNRERRHKRIRAKISGDKRKPRLSVFRSAKGIYAQIIDDTEGKTIVSADSREIKTKKKDNISLSNEVGKLIAQKALEKKIKEVVFDRGGYLYHGRVKALAEGAKKEGLKF